MSVRIDLYDFFAYTIPGGFYLFTIGYLFVSFNLFVIDFQTLNNLSGWVILAVMAIAYVLGLLLDPVAKQWYRLFTRKNITRVVFDEFKANHPDLDIKIQSQDAPIIRAYIENVNTDISLKIEKNGATRTLLRNLSLNFVIFAVVILIHYIRTGFEVWNLILCIILVTLSITSGIQGVKFDKWFHELTYQSVAAFGSEPNDFIARKQKTSSKKQEQSSSSKV